MNKPEERECKNCAGLGSIPRTDGQTMVCQKCNGRGALLFTPEKNPLSSDAMRERAQMLLNDGVGGVTFRSGDPFPYPQSDYQPIPMPIIDPQAAARREYALKTAMAAFQMCNGVSGGLWGTGGKGNGEMEPGEIVPLARQIEQFLNGD